MAVAEKKWDKIRISDLKVRCIVGIYEEERREKQDIAIHITLYADLRQAGQTDRIEDTVNYKAIKKKVLNMAEGSSCHLIERLAQMVADICLEDERVERVEVCVEKPGALRFARTVAVEIERGRG